MNDAGTSHQTHRQGSPPPEDLIPVVIATAERAVIGGLISAQEYREKVRTGQWRNGLVLHRARMCVRWTADVGSALGLAEVGPSASCRVTKARSFPDPHLPVWVGQMTEEAWKRWEAEPWA